MEGRLAMKSRFDSAKANQACCPSACGKSCLNILCFRGEWRRPHHTIVGSWNLLCYKVTRNDQPAGSPLTNLIQHSC